jgi:hypothetical protein
MLPKLVDISCLNISCLNIFCLAEPVFQANLIENQKMRVVGIEMQNASM